MTKNFETIHPHVVVRSAAELMSDLDVGMLPVEEQGEIVGMVTDRDLIVRAIALGSDPNVVTVNDVMTTDTIYCHEDDDVREAAQLMAENQIRRLLVNDERGRVTGILSLADLARNELSQVLSGKVMEEISQPLH
jgi:CBS domain-containing protein